MRNLELNLRPEAPYPVFRTLFASPVFCSSCLKRRLWCYLSLHISVFASRSIPLSFELILLLVAALHFLLAA